MANTPKMDQHITLVETENLRAEIDRFKQATRNAEIGVWEYNLGDQSVFWDKTMYKLYQIEPKKFQNLFEAWMTRLSKREIPKLQKDLTELIKTGGDYSTVYKIYWPNGEARYIKAVANAVQDEKGWTVKLLGTNWDITDQVVNARKMEESLKHTRAFIDQSPSAIALFDTNMNYLAASKQWYNDYNLTGKEIVGKNHYEVLPEIPENRKEIHQKVLKGAWHKDEEALFERGDGEKIWLSTEVRPWFLKEEVIGGIIIYSVNITEKYLAHKQLKISEAQFKGAFNNSGIGMALVSLKGKWIKVNPKVCAIVGYSEKELLNLTFQDITHPGDLDNDLGLLNLLIEGKIPSYQMEKRYFHKSQGVVWVNLNVSLIRDDEGKPIHFVSIIEDITARKNAEANLNDAVNELQESLNIVNDQNQRLTNFAQIVSHNLRSHSGNFNMLLQLLREETDENERHHIEGLLEKAADKLMDTVHNLSEVTSFQLETDKVQKQTSIHKVIERTKDAVQADLIAKSVDVINEVAPQSKVYFVPSYLDSIVLNLMTNSIKYRSPDKESFVKFSMSELDEFYVLKVEDNGLGIDLNRYGHKVFGMYKTFHGNSDARGIGLFLTKNQVESLGGKIEIESKPGEGSTFRIYIRKAHDKI